MSPATRNGHWQKSINSSHNISGVHKHWEQEEVDTRSATTASTPRRSWPGSDDDDRRNFDGRKHGQQLLGMIYNSGVHQDQYPPPPPPPMPASKTRLQSRAALFIPKTAVSSVAEPFVPSGNLPAVPVQSGKECLNDLIQSTLGNEIWSVAMADCQSFSKEWYTAVEITIATPNALLDAKAILAAQQALQSMCWHSLLHAVENFGPEMAIMPSEDTSRISVQYCPTDKDMLCWEFATSGQCPRGSTCRWGHSIIESFLISFVLQPWRSPGYCLLLPGHSPQSMPPVLQQRCGFELPQVPVKQLETRSLPMDKTISDQRNSSTLAALPLTNMLLRNDDSNGYLDDPDDTPWPACVQDLGFSMREVEKENTTSVALTSEEPHKRASGRSWADIQEDSDDDEPFRHWDCPRSQEQA